jgi:serine/threonine protein phosphatase PrpC
MLEHDNSWKILLEHLQEIPNLNSNTEAVLQSIKKTFQLTDEKLKSSVPTHHGCTAVTCLITGSAENRNLFSANVGDTRAILWYDVHSLLLILL